MKNMFMKDTIYIYIYIYLTRVVYELHATQRAVLKFHTCWLLSLTSKKNVRLSNAKSVLFSGAPPRQS